MSATQLNHRRNGGRSLKRHFELQSKLEDPALKRLKVSARFNQARQRSSSAPPRATPSRPSIAKSRSSSSTKHVTKKSVPLASRKVDRLISYPLHPENLPTILTQAATNKSQRCGKAMNEISTQSIPSATRAKESMSKRTSLRDSRNSSLKSFSLDQNTKENDLSNESQEQAPCNDQALLTSNHGTSHGEPNAWVRVKSIQRNKDKRPSHDMLSRKWKDEGILPESGMKSSPNEELTIMQEATAEPEMMRVTSAYNGQQVGAQEHAQPTSGAEHGASRNLWTMSLPTIICSILVAIIASYGFLNGLPHEFTMLLPTGVNERSSEALRAEIERVPKLTLRDVLADSDRGFHLAMAPAFFGFYGYFGALSAWYEALDSAPPIRSVAGASAGAMAAILLAAGVEPDVAADFCATVKLEQFADFPGLGALFKGNKFESMMQEFLESQAKTDPLMQEALIPVAVSAFDLRSLRGKVLREGSMARAARASATFPLLFQPVGWENDTHTFTFIDGGIADMYGLAGLSETMDNGVANRVINMSVGAFIGNRPPGPSVLDKEHGSNIEMISISLLGLPTPGPFALENGPLAFAAARKAMTEMLDTPLEPVVEVKGMSLRPNHYQMRVAP